MATIVTAHYKAAMDDVKNGRVYHASSVDDMFLETGTHADIFGKGKKR